MLPVSEMEGRLDVAVAKIPDLELRLRAARLSEPEHLQAIRFLCEQAGLVYERMTAGMPGPGGMRIGFIASGSPYVMVPQDDLRIATPFPEGDPVALCRVAG